MEVLLSNSSLTKLSASISKEIQDEYFERESMDCFIQRDHKPQASSMCWTLAYTKCFCCMQLSNKAPNIAKDSFSQDDFDRLTEEYDVKKSRKHLLDVLPFFLEIFQITILFLP